MFKKLSSIKHRVSYKKFLSNTSLFLFCLLAVDVNAQMAKHLDKPKVAALPMISYNRSYGGIFGGFASLYFQSNKKDTISPASSVGTAGFYATNGTWFIFGFAKLYYKKDLFRTVIAGGTGDQNFQYFNENYETGGGSFINYTTLLDFFAVEQLVRVYGRLYTGLDFVYYNAETSYEDSEEQPDVDTYAALGIPFTFDNRDNVQNPGKGWFSNARFKWFDDALGSATEYTKLDLDASLYTRHSDKKVIAYKASISTGLGTVPFEAQTIVGGKVIRGYSKGEYRGDQVYSLQGEYRWNFYKKWGSVFFAGVATPVTKNVSWSSSDILPSIGAGIRFMMIPDLRLNVGFDASVGKDDYGLYFRIGEYF